VLVLLRPTFTVLGVGIGSAAIFVAYVAGTRAIYRQAGRQGSTLAVPSRGADAERPRPSLRRSVLGFAIAAGVVLLASPVFAWSAKGIAEVTGLGNTFVGTLLVGLSTSLPELVASLSAVRMGAFDLAVGNLFGSNGFNMAIFIVLDAVQPGSLFAVVDANHAISGLVGVILMSLGLAAIGYRAKKRFAMIEPDSFLMLAGYLLGVWVLYTRAVEGAGWP